MNQNAPDAQAALRLFLKECSVVKCSIPARSLTLGEQELRLRSEVVATDHIIIEAIRYETPAALQSELTNLVIKKGAYQSCSTTLTRMPKYVKRLADTAVAIFITSVPKVSLSLVLDEIERYYPSYYNSDPISFIANGLAGTLRLVRTTCTNRSIGWLQKFDAVLNTTGMIWNRRIPLRARKRFAARLVQSVQRHHGCGIIHHNITAHTIFFISGVQYKFLANYTGVDSPHATHFLPPALTTPEALKRWGESCRDTYILSCLVFAIITGRQFDSTRFGLDSSASVAWPQLPARELQKNPLVWLPFGLKFIRGCIQSIRMLFDSDYQSNYRALTRASGGLWRTLPVFGMVADILLPTQLARVVRSICNREYYGARPGRLPGTLKELCTALYNRKPDRSIYQIETIIEDLARSAQEVSDETTSSIQPNKPSALRLKKNVVLLVAAIGLIIVITGVLLFPTTRTYLSFKAQNDVRNNRISEPSSTLNNTEAVNNKKTNPALKNRTKTTIKRPPENFLKSSDKIVHQTPKPEESKVAILSPVVQPPPPPTLVRVDAKSVYIITNAPEPIDAGALFFTDATGTITLKDRASAMTKYFICKKQTSGFGRIMPVRKCTGKFAQCEQGLFYEAVGYGDTGERALLKDGDLLAFNYFDLSGYLDKLKQ